MAATEVLLEAKGVTKRFGGLVAVRQMDYVLHQGQISSIIGPNGAGKTTFFNTLTGIYRPEEGQIHFSGHSLVGRRPDQVAALGMARTFQNIRLFANMTVIENVLVGMFTLMHQSIFDILLRDRRFKGEEIKAHDRALELLEFVGLGDVGNELTRNLPYGVQRRVEIARGLASNPRLLLLDEPTAGMNPAETDDATALFRRLRDQLGITILLIEHDMRVVMGISDQITVLDYGTKIAEGMPKEIQSNQRVIEAYLGPDVTSLTQKYQLRKKQRYAKS